MCLPLLFGALLLAAPACRSTDRLERTLTPPERYETLDREAPFLKAHMQNGHLYVFSDWHADSAAVEGYGSRLGLNRDTLDLVFAPPPPGQRVGLVVGARRTLLTTFLLYQTLAYMGHDAGAWLAMLERGDQRLRNLDLNTLLGGVEVLVQDTAGAWQTAGTVAEHGPLAPDVHVIPLSPTPSAADRLQVRLRLTKGDWRRNYLALADLGAPTHGPVRVPPQSVRHRGRRAHGPARQCADARDLSRRCLCAFLSPAATP